MEFIGIVGPSGAGKSTLCKELKKHSRQIEHIRLDYYFKNPKTFPKKFGFPNWERPSNLKFDELLRHLKALSKNKVVYANRFSKKTGTKAVIIKPKKYILVEGFVLFANKEVRNFFDKKIYLDIPTKTILKRRAMRFGTEDINYYDTRVTIPEYLKFGIKQKKYADYIIDGTKPRDEILKQVKKIISQ